MIERCSVVTGRATRAFGDLEELQDDAARWVVLARHTARMPMIYQMTGLAPPNLRSQELMLRLTVHVWRSHRENPVRRILAPTTRAVLLNPDYGAYNAVKPMPIDRYLFKQRMKRLPTRCT